MFISNDSIIDDFEISAVLLLNATSHTCAKIFADINGNQAKVSKSVIYDLYDLLEVDKEEEILMKSLHNICNKLNTDPESPLYRHIKMLGIGQGAISQAFFLQYLRGVIKELTWENKPQQFIYDNLFLYLKCFQRIFYNVWPVLEMRDYKPNTKNQWVWCNYAALPNVYKMLGEHDYKDYYMLLNKLSGKIDWINDDTIKQGTRKKTQNAVKQKLLSILENDK